MFDALKEQVRESNGEDVNFLKDMTYFFELEVPKSVSPQQQTFLFPLILGPESYTLTEPFALTETETQGSGLIVEENGIIKRNLRIQGHTGWKPRTFRGSAGIAKVAAPSAGRSYVREILEPYIDLSGQKHFHFLQDAVFRAYADLKRDSATSAETRMFFHIPRETEHWEVKPRSFTLTRALESRNLYRYDIDLLIVGPAKIVGEGKSEDKGLLDTIKDGVRMVQSGIDLVRSTIQDVTAFVNDIEKTIKGIGATINSVVGIVDDAADFVNGVASVIASPFESVNSVITSLDVAIAQMGESTRAFPDTIVNSFRQMQSGLDRIGSFPEYFQSDSRRALESAMSSIHTSVSIAALREAAALAPPNSFQKLLAMGTAPLPGDLVRARSELPLNKDLSTYQSAKEYVLSGSDTMHSLAAKFLGDARLWRHIAVLNGLSHPFISREGIPGTKRAGDKILIPSKDPAPVARSITPVLGVSPTASAEDRILGTDVALERADGPGDLFDIAIDYEGGATDVKLAAGVENLTQALLSRLRTERGTDQLYRNVGIDRIMGLVLPALGPQIVELRVSQAVQADPRITAIRSIDVEQPSSDSIIINLDAEVVGISGAQPVSLRL